MARALNPCLICGGLAAGPKGGTVCDVCRAKVARYDDLEAQLQQETCIVALPLHPRAAGGGADSALGKLNQALMQFRRALPPPDLTTTQGRDSMRPYEGDVQSEHYNAPGSVRGDYARYRMPTTIAQAYADIEGLIGPALSEAQERGRSQGTHLLAQLAAGTLTSPEFERQAGIAPK